MTRVRAESLVLVNWKGVFFEHYRLDRHVTGLEGDNGAGKTTAMIAAYVVLMPDLTRLRFTNLGETGATGGDRGLWGRLGEPSRPTYAALALRVAGGARLVAGVHVERKGEPSLDFTPFLVDGLADDVALDELLLIRDEVDEAVPELAALRANVGRLGGRLRTFPTAKEYFGALFDHGVTPMRLATDEERAKFNDMLRTSMTGGMSRNLLGDLRNFLLPRATHLASSLQTMRENLDTCRRTRAEVLENQQLEAELRSVADAGEAMVAGYLVGTRRRAEERTRTADETAAQHREHEARALDLEGRVAHAERAHDEALARRAAADEAARRASAWATTVEEAVAWAGRRDEAIVALAQARTAHADAARRRHAASAEAEATAQALELAQERREQAAQGLEQLDRGVELLIRRAAEHAAATTRWDGARDLLGQPDLPLEDAGLALDRARSDRDAVDAARRSLGRRLADAQRHRDEHAAAMVALTTIDPAATDAAAAHATARAALTTVGRWRERAERRARLEADVRAARADVERQARARRQARDLGFEASFEGAAADAVQRALEAADADWVERTDAAHAADAEAATARHGAAQARAEVATLTSRATAYAALAATAARLAAALEIPLMSANDLAAARRALTDTEAAVATRLREAVAARDRLHEEARQLRARGGRFDPALLRLRDAIGADLLAARFDDVAPDEAAELEARLGPLAGALEVADVEAAGAAVAADEGAPASVWLVGENAPLPASAPATLDGAVQVDADGARRVTRLPARPTLGSAARERTARELDHEADAFDAAVAATRSEADDLARLRHDADALLAGASLWSQGDPAAELADAHRRGEVAENAERDAQAEAAAARTAARDLEARRSGLRRLLPDASLLDGPEVHDRLAELEAAWNEADRAARELARVGDAPERLASLLDALARAPWTPEAEAAARDELDALDARRDALSGAVEALGYVLEHRDALTWTDAAARLAHDQALQPALNAQLEDAKRALELAKQRDAAARADLTSAFDAAIATQGALESAQRRHDEAVARLEQLAVAAPSAASLAEARSQATAAAATAEAADATLRTLVDERARVRAAWEVAKVDLAASAAQLAEARAGARAASDAWVALERRMGTEGWLAAEALDRHAHALPGGASMTVFEAARDQRVVLLERLASARDAADARAEVERTTSESVEDGAAATVAIQAWLAVRAWLHRRLPAQVAQGDDLDASMRRFRDRLGDLAAKLDRQEGDLRGSSRDVANAVQVQIRRAHTRVQRLNGRLEHVAFGSVGRLRVRLDRIERMAAVLRALESGAAQGLLFEADLPIEEAMRRVLEEHAKVRSGADGVLDYRQYLELHVEIRRRGDDGWEEANPARLSTGEAIGVGAALMMVVLTEWEDDANLVRGRRAVGSLRLLLLDEANRLDATNLGTVFDLCRELDLQLLMAAPEVARAEGCTVYRLVRDRDDQGRELVRVSGRRMIAPPTAP